MRRNKRKVKYIFDGDGQNNQLVIAGDDASQKVIQANAPAAVAASEAQPPNV